MKRFAFLLFFVSSFVLAAGSTVNGTIPAANSALQSSPIRANFLAAETDINNLIGMNNGVSAPASPILDQLWMNTTSNPYALNIFDGASWATMGTLNTSTHVFSVASVPWSGVTGTPTTLAGYGITNAVSSVSLTMPSIFNVTGSPVTGIGTFVATFANQSQGLVFASPATVTGAPSFRSLVATDLPSAGLFATLDITGHVIMSGLATTGTISGSICQDSSGNFIYNAGGNCFNSAGSASSLAAGATIAGSTSLPGAIITNALEAADVISSAPASTTNFYFASGAVQYYTSNAANNWTLNFAWSSGTTFNSATSTPGVGATATGVLLVTQGSTPYYATSVEVDGTTTGVTTKWLGGTAPSAGNASGIDAYTCSIIKTATTPTYSVLCSLSQY